MKKHFSLIALVAMLFVGTTAEAKVEHLLPKPQSVETSQGGAFALGRAVSIVDETNSSLLKQVFIDNKCTIDDAASAKVVVEMVPSIAGAHDYNLSGYENEAYTITISANEVKITAITKTGVIRAAQTIAQLAQGYKDTASLEAVEIVDWPAFKLRGYMHDVGRSFISVETLKKHIDLLSRFKVNTFHWHMTENQAWRFEVKAYPQLTSTASMTRFAGKYYTQEQCREVEQYAAERGVIVIPEIDMPGHSEAFVRAMGVDMQSAEGKVILKKALDELAATFPLAPYIHIGADEMNTTEAYLDEMIGYVRNTLGRKCVVWNPVRNVGVNQLDAELTQMWSTSGVAVSGKANIDCRYNYTNHFDVFADLVGIYKSTIFYETKGNETVAGTISACWNDRKLPTEEDIVAQNNFYANVIASSSRAWTGGGERYIDNGNRGGTNFGGGVMLPNSGSEFDDFADWERRFLFHKERTLKGEPIPYVKQTNVRWRISDAFDNGGNMSAVFPPEEMKDADKLPEEFTYNGVKYGTGIATGAGIYLRHTWGNATINAYYSNPQYNQTAYAWTYVYSPKAQTVGAIIEFQNYSRSEQDPVPTAGNWDLYGSKIWINGSEVAAPNYKNGGKSISSKEVDQLDENFPAREPVQVELKEGWNKVFLKLPYKNAAYRLDKWMFTFVLTDLEGKNAVDGLIYSPNQCIDEAAELLSITLSEVKAQIATKVSDNPGFYSAEYAEDLNKVIAEIEATLSTEMTAEERAAQVEALNAALAAFNAAIATATINQPKVSEGGAGYYYSFRTPLRGNRYATGKGASAEMVGETTPSAASYWKFVARADGTYDIVNYADGTYISPASNNNTALRTVTASPANGWTIKPANEVGYVIITSGTAQFNQTNNATLGYKVYNWGGGTNIDDTGCKYLVEEETELAEIPEPVEAPVPFLVVNDMGGSYPYQVAEDKEALVFEKENLTMAFDLTSGSAAANNEAFFAASVPTSACQETDPAATSFTAVGAHDGKVRFFISAKSGQFYTRGGGLTPGADHKVVLVFAKGENTKCYVDGTMYDAGLVQNLHQYAGNANANLYIGGGVTSAGTTYPFKGNIRSVHFFDRVLTGEEIAVIDYDVETAIDGVTIENGSNEIYDLYGRKVAAPSKGIYIVNGKKVLVK